MVHNDLKKFIPIFSKAQAYNLYFLLVVGRTFNSCLNDESITPFDLEHDFEGQKDLQAFLRAKIFRLAESYPEFASVKLIDDFGEPNIENPITKDFYRRINRWSAKRGWWKKASSTSGSSGISLTIIRSPKSFLNNQISFFRFFTQFGISRFDKNIYVGGARKSEVSVAKKMINWGTAKILNTKKFVATDMVSDNQFSEFIEVYESFKPTYLHGFSSALLRIAEYVQRENILLKWKPKLIHPNAEGISSSQREMLSGIFGAPVAMIYGSAECHMASECEHGVMHVNMRSCELATKSDGSAVLTVFESDYMPMVNYQMGDLIKIEEPACACSCGKHTAIITDIIGRLNEQFTLPSGRVLTHPDLNMLIQQIDVDKSIREYQLLHYSGTSSVEVRVLTNDYFDQARFVASLNMRFHDADFFCSDSAFVLLANAKKPVMLTVNEVPHLRKTYDSYVPYSEISESQLKQNNLSLLKLDWNESTADFPLHLKKRAFEDLSLIPLNNYPDLQASDLKSAIGEWLEIHPKCLTVFNGSDAGIATICRLYLEDTDSVVTIEPTYGNYRAIASRYTKKIDSYQLIYPFVLDFNSFSEFLKEGDPKLVFFTNPNNPTGVEHPRESIFCLAKNFPRTCFILDEAYVEFGDNSLSVDDIPSNVIILRTFSKAFGLAGVRLGYSITTEDLASKISLSKDNKEVDVFAQITGSMAVRNPSYMYEYVQSVGKGRAVLTDFLDKRQIMYLAGKGNFVLFKVADPFEVEKQLKDENIFIRNRTQVKHLDGYVRVTLGDEISMKKFVRALAKYL